MGWILPPGGIPELAHTISRNLYGKPPKQLTPPEQDVVIAWIAGRAPVTEAEVRRDLLVDWVDANEAKGTQLAAHNGGAAPVSSSTQTRSVNTSPLGARLGQLSTTSKPKQGASDDVGIGVSAAKDTITLWEGARRLDDAGTFLTLAKKGELPGLGAMSEVKFIITGAQSEKPELCFMNTNAYEAHAAFAKSALGAKVDLAGFNAAAYFDPARDVVCGSVVAVVDGAGDDGKITWALQFLPTDPMTPGLVAMADAAVKKAAPFLKDALVYHPVGQGQADVAAGAKAAFDGAGVKVKSTQALLGALTFSPLNQGTGYGVLRLIDGSDPRPPPAKDVVIFSRLPNDLSHTAGVITLDPQTPLSHVNLKAKQNGTPNAYIKGADELKDIKRLIGQVVKFEVTSSGYTLEAASSQEAKAHMESLRPTTSTTPPRDLSEKKPKALGSLSHKDLKAFGAKSVNAAELAKVLPAEQRMDGMAVPFAMYDNFMKANGLYDQAKAMMAEPRFQSDDTYRENQLKRFRRTMRDTPLPPALSRSVAELQAHFGPDAALRLRSSTNNEDLAGFNGAGLYSSRTFEPKAAPTAQKSGFGDVMKDVWSSLWSFRAFEEREFHRVDHFHTAMGVLVHPSYDNEGAAGVAVTKNIYDPHAPGLYVNVQPHDDLVTSPEGGVVPEELLLRPDARTGGYVPQVLRQSSVAGGAAVLSPEHTQQLASALDQIQQHFRGVYGAHGDAGFAMDVEFIVDNDRIRVLQARPWVD